MNATTQTNSRPISRRRAMLPALATIARQELGIETVEERGSDRLDFHEVSAMSIRRALEAAYAAGQDAQRRAEA